MAQFPCLPLWTDALLADTAHLSDAEFGRYMRVLILMWRTPGCRTPNDDVWLARHLPHTKAIEDIRAIVAEYCQIDGNWIAQKRLRREFVRAHEFRGRMSDLRKRRKNKRNGANTSSTTNGAEPPLSSTPTPTPTTGKASSPGESQYTPPVNNSSHPESPPASNPPVTEPDPTQQDPSASARATALPEGAPARSPPSQQDPQTMTLAEINARWRPAGTRP